MRLMDRNPVKTYKIKESKSAIRYAVIVLLVTYTIFFVALVGWTFLNSLKGLLEYNKDKLSLPKDWLFSNYKLAFETMSAGGRSFVTLIFNAVWVAAGTVLIGQATVLLFAYVMARFDFPLRKFFDKLNIFILVVPIMGSMPAFMKVMTMLGLYDSPLYILTAISGFGGGLVIYRTAFRNVPWEYAEAAYIDGASHVQVFLKLMIPQVLPLIIATLIGAFTNVWNDSMTPLLYLPSYPTLASGLYVYQVEMARKIHTPVLFAGCFMCSIPPIILFIVFNKYMMNVDLSGGLKG